MNTSQPMLIQALSMIPSHRQSANSIQRMAEDLASSCAIAPLAAQATVEATVAFLAIFDVLENSDIGVKLKSQIPTYFRDSLVWYLSNQSKVTSNWDRLGTSRNLHITHLLDSAPYFFRILEERRLALAQQYSLNATPTREQACSVVLIKGLIQEKLCILHQWDQEAERYQLIGGKCRDGESHFETACREFHEETADHGWVYGRDYELLAMGNDPIQELGISRTYGALTAYKIMPFKAIIKTQSFKLSESNKWISIEEIRSGMTHNQKLIAPFCKTLEGIMPNAIVDLQVSVQQKHRWSYLDYIEAKVGIPGFRVDIKKIWFTWFPKKGD